MDAKNIHKNAEEIRRRLGLRTYSLAIKMLKSQPGIPEEAKRPVRDMRCHLDLCQGFSISRWQGETIAMLKEDMWCFEPVIGYGLAEPPQYFLEGNNRFPQSAMTREAGRNWARSLPHLKVGEYVGIVSAPLEECSFEPDMFMIYCEPAQLTQLLMTKNCIDGGDVTCTLSGHAACVYAVVPVLQNRQCLVASPCRGDRRIAMTQWDEIIFSAPTEMLGDLVKALRYLEEHELGFPWPFELKPEHELAESYARIGEMMGMKYQ